MLALRGQAQAGCRSFFSMGYLVSTVSFSWVSWDSTRDPTVLFILQKSTSCVPGIPRQISAVVGLHVGLCTRATYLVLLEKWLGSLFTYNSSSSSLLVVLVARESSSVLVVPGSTRVVVATLAGSSSTGGSSRAVLGVVLLAPADYYY